MCKDFRTHIILHFSAHNMADIRNIIICSKLYYGQYYQHCADYNDPLYGLSRPHIYNVGCNISDHKRYDKTYYRSQKCKNHIREKCTHVWFIVSGHFSEIILHIHLQSAEKPSFINCYHLCVNILKCVYVTLSNQYIFEYFQSSLHFLALTFLQCFVGLCKFRAFNSG